MLNGNTFEVHIAIAWREITKGINETCNGDADFPLRQ
jgi:hypothetical protein